MAYQQRCILCRKTMVLITSYRQKPICATCDMRDLEEQITNKKWQKFFDINPELYKKIPFLRSIKKNYLRQETLTKKQIDTFKKVVKEETAKQTP